MTQEEKELLLKDLCARLPYHPKGHVVNACNGAECDERLTCATFTMFTNITNNCRLYLRPMTSMTEEEKTEYRNIVPGVEWNYGIKFPTTNKIDWLNKKMFDYRGLIERGLAIEVTKYNNPYKE